jgi:hypothetical protein
MTLKQNILKTLSSVFLFFLRVRKAKAIIVRINNLCYYLDPTQKTARVTNSPSYDEYVNDELIIPSEITYKGVVYTVNCIESGAFYKCYDLIAVTIPDSVTDIGESAFKDCRDLESMTIGNAVTAIGNKAFYYCGKLTSINIPDSVERIGSWAFSWCSSLTSIIIPNSVNALGEKLFFGCSSMKSISIGHSVTEIGEGSFLSAGLTSLTLPDSVTAIHHAAFFNCQELQTVVLPNSITYLGDWVFRDDSIIEMHVSWPIPLKITSGTFFNATIETLYVPTGTKELYAAAEVWNIAKNIVEEATPQIGRTVRRKSSEEQLSLKKKVIH